MKKIDFKHDFYENALTATVKYLVMLFQPFANQVKQPVVVGFINLGDEKFTSDMIIAKKDYDFTPRCTLDLGGFSEQRGDLSNKNTYGNFEAINLDTNKIEHYSAKMQRKPIDVVINAELVFSNVFEYMTFLELYLMLTDEYHSFIFYHAGKKHEAILELPEFQDSETNTTFGLNSETRQRKMVLTFNLKTQFPAYRIYGLGGTNFVGNNDYNDDSGNTGDGGGGKPTGEAGNGNDGGNIVYPMDTIIHNIEFSDENNQKVDPKITQIITKQ